MANAELSAASIPAASTSQRAGALYRTPVRATRRGPLFNAFPYPTKISPETVALFIASHTRPGQTVVDCFAGSGTTGLGAILCARPSESVKRIAETLGLPARWGPRHAILFEIGVLGSFISRILCSPPDPAEFTMAAESLIHRVEQEYGWLYRADDPLRQTGVIRYAVWSDILECPSCGSHRTLWDACVRREPARVLGRFHCDRCGRDVALDEVRHSTETYWDDLLGESRSSRSRRPAWVYGSTNGRNWARQVQASDLSLLKRVATESLPPSVPRTAVPWGDLHRSGYHEGITHVHHFYTRRNLIAFGALWEQVDSQPSELREALRFWLLSYNASHTTLMTRVVAKRRQRDLVVTSAQPGVLYVSGLPVEKNVFAGLRRKLKTIRQAFDITHGCGDLVEVRNMSCLATGLPDECVDYIFTDPPFGGNIPYAEVNFLNEAWLGSTTDMTDEVIISPHQGKSVDSYQGLLLGAFREAHRVLRDDGNATVAFHSASAQVWSALRTAYGSAGFAVANTSVLDKTQGSFKQVTTAGSVRGDPIILLTKRRNCTGSRAMDQRKLVDDLVLRAEATGDPAEMTPKRMYSRLVANCVASNQEVPMDAKDFYRQLAHRQMLYANNAR